MIITTITSPYESPYDGTGYAPVYDDSFIFDDEETIEWEEMDEIIELPRPNTPPAHA